VRHFIYVSSVKVYGDEASGFLDETTPCQPTDAYGRSKLKAEEYLQSVRSETFKVAIVRPPLVYGPGVKGNMIRLLELSGRDIPLPFGNAGNARSMVFIDNLIELIFRIVDKQAEGVFVAGDREPMSTDRLITMMRRAMGRSPGLFSLPTLFRKIIRKFRPALYTRLFGSFVIDNQATNRTLDFVPPYPSEAGIREMVAWFNKINGK
jgi:UDP-glucose 4-epimerase